MGNWRMRNAQECAPRLWEAQPKQAICRKRKLSSTLLFSFPFISPYICTYTRHILYLILLRKLSINVTFTRNHIHVQLLGEFCWSGAIASNRRVVVIYSIYPGVPFILSHCIRHVYYLSREGDAASWMK